MAYTPGFDIRTAAEGSKAATAMELLPAEKEARKAEIEAGKAKSTYEVERYKGLQEYMKAERAAPPLVTETPDAATIAGQNAYSTISLGQELQQRKAEIAKEEQALKLLAPEDKFHAETRLERARRNVDTIESKILKQTEQHYGEQFSLLDSVKDEASLQGARSYARRGLEEMANKAVADGKIDPSNKDNFIRDQLNQMLPQKYDNAGKAMIETQKNGMLTISEQVKIKREQDEAKKAEAAVRRAENETTKLHNIQIRSLASGDKQRLKETISTFKEQIDNNTKLEKEYEDKAEQYDGLASDVKNIDPAKQKYYQDLANQYRERARDISGSNKPLLDSMKALGEELLPEKVKGKLKAKVNPASLTGQDKAAYDWAKANPSDPRAKAIIEKLGV